MLDVDLDHDEEGGAFTKNVDKWADYYRANKNIEVRPVGNEFAGYLLRCAGLVASPSPGVVTQALAIGRPCYLLCPPGHLEQQFNEDYYFKYFTGVTKPSMQGIGEWAASIKTTDDLLPLQAQKIRDWPSSSRSRRRRRRSPSSAA